MKIVKVGDKVRSFDFHHKDKNGINACYVEGILKVLEVTHLGEEVNMPNLKLLEKYLVGKKEKKH